MWDVVAIERRKNLISGVEKTLGPMDVNTDLCVDGILQAGEGCLLSDRYMKWQDVPKMSKSMPPIKIADGNNDAVVGDMLQGDPGWNI